MDGFSHTSPAPAASNRTAPRCLAPLNISHCKRRCRYDFSVGSAAVKSRRRLTPSGQCYTAIAALLHGATVGGGSSVSFLWNCLDSRYLVGRGARTNVTAASLKGSIAQ
jgi:hypothetical protein